jgi:hypothetical protein
MSNLGCGNIACEFMRLLVARVRTVYVRTHSYDQGVHNEYDCMQLFSREQWTVTVMDEWDFYRLENSAFKVLLLQEVKEFWVHELFIEAGTKGKHRQLFPDLLKPPKMFSNIFE